KYLIDDSPLGFTPIKLDFANRSLQVEPLKVLEEISRQTREACDKQIADNFIDTLQKVRKQLAQQILEKIQVSSTNNQIQLLDSQTQQDIHQKAIELRQEILEGLYTQLATYRRERLIIMFDTCEWLNESEDNEIADWFKDELVPGLCQHVRIPFHVVIASRTRPQFQNIEQSDQQQLKLSQLAEEAVNTYLRSIAKYDEQLSKNIYQITQGHPLCISIIATLLQENQENSAFTLGNFESLEKKFTERALVEFIQERLDSHLRSPFRELTHYGVLLRSFDWELLQTVFPEFLSGPNSYHHFEQLTRYSHVEEIEDRKDKHYSIHILLREILVENIRTQEFEEWRKYHELARNYYARLHKAEQYYHAIALDEQSGIIAWKEAVLKALDTESTHLLELL